MSMKIVNSTRDTHVFSKPFKIFVAVLTIFLITISVFCLYIVGGQWKFVLVGSIFSIIILGLGMKSATRAARGILTEKEKEDVEVLKKSKFINFISRIFMNSNVFSVASIITIYANLTRWMMFNILLLVTVIMIMVKGFNYAIGIFSLLFFMALWFPVFDKPLLKKWTYVRIILIKLLVTAALTFFVVS